MLYVSRDFHNDSYGVYDTDDGTEELITFTDLAKVTIDDGIDVKGITTQDMSSLGIKSIFLDTVIPYQDPQFYTKAQAKLKTLRGIDIHTWKDEITYIGINGHVFPEKLSVRLSDYGKTMHGEMDVMWYGTKQGKSITLVLDDKLYVYGGYPTVGLAGVIWDVSEVSSGKLVAGMFKQLESEGLGANFWHNFVIDRQNRHSTRRW